MGLRPNDTFKRYPDVVKGLREGAEFKKQTGGVPDFRAILKFG